MAVSSSKKATSPTPHRILLSAGGTGGHVFPAYALAESLLEQGHHVMLATDSRGASFSAPPKHLQTKVLCLPKSTQTRAGKIKLLLLLFPAILQALIHLIRFRPQAIIGFGGFPSLPALIAGLVYRIFFPTKLIMHEQNAFIGRVNRYLLPFLDRIATSFPHTQGIHKKWHTKACHTGNLVRKSFSKSKDIPYIPPRDTEPFHIFIIGGSQGARSFSTLIPQALSSLPATLRARLHITQQCRIEVHKETQAAYAGLGIQATLQPFFQDIHTHMQEAHLIISRSGSSSVFEISGCGRPALYIPFPFAMDNHQVFNANALVEKKAAWILEEKNAKPDVFSRQLKELLTSPKKLAIAAKNAHDFGAQDSRKSFCDLIETLIKSERNEAHGYSPS